MKAKDIPQIGTGQGSSAADTRYFGGKVVKRIERP